MTKENNKVDINKHEMDIDTLKKQNVNDLLSLKELYNRIEELGEKITQIKYIDSTLANKLKKEYEKLKRIILDENVSVTLSNEIETVNTKLTNEIETVNTKLTNDIETVNEKLSNDIETVNSQLVTINSQLTNNIETINSQLETIEKQTKVFVNIKNFEKYKVEDDWSNAIDKAVDYINTTECFELYFPPGTYKVTRPIKAINRIGCISGNSKLDTIIEYTPVSDSTLLRVSVNSNLITYFSIKDITFKCTSKSYKVNGVVCSKGEISQNLWGTGISIKRCRVLGFTGVGIKIYAPFMSKIDSVYISGAGYKSSEDILTGMKSVGIELTGSEGDLNTFGNVNSICNSMIAECCYGLKIVSVGNINVDNTTFEPNFINVYAYRTNKNGFCDNINFNNCWFENYKNDGHSKYGAFCIYEFDENKGDIKEGQTSFNRAGIYNNMSRIHSSCSDNSLRVTHRPGGGFLNGSLIGNIENENENIPILVYSSDFGTPISIGTKKSSIHAHTTFNRGITHCYSNKNQSWLSSREQHLLYSKDITAPTSETIESIVCAIPEIFNTPEILEVKANIAIKTKGNNIMITKSECIINNLNNIVDDTNKTTVINNPWGDLKEIEEGFTGSKLSFDKSTKTITVSVKSSTTYGIKVNLELKASYINSEIK